MTTVSAKLTVHLPFAIPALFSEHAAKAVQLVDLLRELFTEPSPATFSFLVTVSLVLLHSREPEIEELNMHLQALEPDRVTAELAQLS